MKYVLVESCSNPQAMQGLVNLALSGNVSQPSKDAMVKYITKDTIKQVNKTLLNLNLIDANDIFDLCKNVTKGCKFDKNISKAKLNPSSFKILKAL